MPVAAVLQHEVTQLLNYSVTTVTTSLTVDIHYAIALVTNFCPRFAIVTEIYPMAINLTDVYFIIASLTIHSRFAMANDLYLRDIMVTNVSLTFT